MTNRERLQENYEDALFALLMDDVAQTEGARLIRENEALRADPNAAVPAEIDRRCKQVIQRTLAKRKHGMSLRKFGQQICRAAVIATIITSLFISAYAFSPSFRAGTLNLLLEIDDKVATWRFDDGSLPQLPEEEGMENDISFDFSNIPDGYTITEIDSSPNQMYIKLLNTQGIQVDMDIFKITDTATYTYDVENFDYYEEITYEGMTAILTDKRGVLSIAWADKERGLFYNAVSKDASLSELKELMKEIK